MLYSCHDTSLIPLLVAMGIYDWKWPPFAADIAFELYEDKKGEHWVKVQYLGEVSLFWAVHADLMSLLRQKNDRCAVMFIAPRPKLELPLFQELTLYSTAHSWWCTLRVHHWPILLTSWSHGQGNSCLDHTALTGSQMHLIADLDRSTHAVDKDNVRALCWWQTLVSCMTNVRREHRHVK